jgi:hypothetical protein
MVNTRTNDHVIAEDGKTTLTADPSPGLVLNSAVSQHGGFAHDYAPLVENLRIGQFVVIRTKMRINDDCVVVLFLSR